MVVIGLVALLFGMGAGMLSTLNPGQRAAVGLAQNALRAAHNNAIARQAGARVRIDATANTLQAVGMSVVGTWQFETLGLEGSSGIDGVARGGRLIEDGFLGKALSFVGEPAGSHAEIPVQLDPGFDLRDGFRIECALSLEEDKGEQGGRVLRIGETAGLECRPGGVLRAWFRPQAEQGAVALGSSGVERSGGGMVAVDSKPGAWRTGRWFRVVASYDRRFLRLEVDGVEIAREPEDAAVSKVQAPITLADERSAFPGAIDALTIYAVVDSALTRLPKGVVFGRGTPAEIVFAPGGALDREVHAGPVSFTLEFDDGAPRRVTVNMYGTVE